MRKFLLANVLALAALAVLPDTSHAWGRDNYSAHGYGWLGSLAFRHMQWIHQDGPLYNYGPYNGQGTVDMHIPKPWHGSYTPADPTLWNRGASAPVGYAPAGYMPAAPAAGYAPTAYPTIPPQHIAAKPIGLAPRPIVQPVGYSTSNPYTAVYPWWLTSR